MSESPLVGTWKLISFNFKTVNEHPLYPLGENPVGFIIYTADGYVSVNLSQSDRLPFMGDDLVGTAEEMSGAYQTSIAYAGTYTFDHEAAYHQIQVSNYPNWTGRSQTRYYWIEGSRLVLTSPPLVYEGTNGILTLHLERVL